jgi:anti-sigma factor RsiW
MPLLIQAHVDGELTAAEIATVEAHLEHCANCAELQARLIGLSTRMREELTYHREPDALRAAVRARLAAAAPTQAQAQAPVQVQTQAQPGKVANDNATPWWRRLTQTRLTPLAPFGTGFALAAGLAMFFILPHTGNLPDAVVSDHIRALQPGHLMDVVSTDQHTVKPWFDGRLDFAPPVKDFNAKGFPLAGGRLDYLAGRQVAALIYHRHQHVIDLYVWPDEEHGDTSPTPGSLSGYNFLHWRQGGMVFWAVSDLEPGELAEFARLIRTE